MKGCHPTVAEINLSALSYNLNQVRLKVGSEKKIIAIVKANAYGHGAVEIAKRASASGADILGVGTVEEGMEIREAGVISPILVLTGFFKGDEEYIVSHNLSSVIYTYESALLISKEAEKSGKTVGVHIKVDTGMERLGIHPSETKEFLKKISSLKNIKVEGILTHFAAAYEPDKKITEKQIEIFKNLIHELQQDGYFIPLIHTSNSAAILKYPESYFSAVRPGIILYGSIPFKPPSGDFKPVMSWKTRIIYINSVPQETGISYGRSFITKRKSVIATIPIGYADGYSRSLSNKAEVLAGGIRVPQVGVICMDVCMIDITGLQNVKVGDEVVLIGKQGDEEIRVEELASLAGTIPYEIFCSIGRRVKRIYKEN
jgi:alanine racemase